MEILNKKIELKISTKVALSFIIIVLLQGIISLIALTLIISRSQNDSFKAQMKGAFLGIEGYLDETLNALNVNANLLAGQTKIIDYTDFGLQNLFKRGWPFLNRPSQSMQSAFIQNRNYSSLQKVISY